MESDEKKLGVVRLYTLKLDLEKNFIKITFLFVIL